MTLNKASERMNHSQKHSTTGRNGNSGSHGARNGAQASKWVVGDACLAKYWEDGNFYDAQITALSKTTAVVFFQEYGNHEEVMLTDIMNVPFSGQGINSSRSSKRSGDSRFIPATPGLPPAFKQSTT